MSQAPNDPQYQSPNVEHEPRHDRPLTASVEKLRRELDHWLDVAWSQGEKALDAFGLKSGFWSPAVDVVEKGDDILVFVDVPGINPQTIELTLAGNMLTLKGERFCTRGDDDGHVHLRTRPRGKFHRSIPLPIPVDSDKVAADAKDGVLTIRLTKSERAKTRQIPVGGRESHTSEF
jgi:HSP20 family protein